MCTCKLLQRTAVGVCASAQGRVIFHTNCACAEWHPHEKASYASPVTHVLPVPRANATQGAVRRQRRRAPQRAAPANRRVPPRGVLRALRRSSHGYLRSGTAPRALAALSPFAPPPLAGHRRPSCPPDSSARSNQHAIPTSPHFKALFVAALQKKRNTVSPVSPPGPPNPLAGPGRVGAGAGRGPEPPAGGGRGRPDRPRARGARGGGGGRVRRAGPLLGDHTLRHHRGVRGQADRRAGGGGGAPGRARGAS